MFVGLESAINKKKRNSLHVNFVKHQKFKESKVFTEKS